MLINQSINKKTNHKNDQWCTTNLRAKIKPKNNVQNVKKSQKQKARWNSNVLKFRMNDGVSDSSWSDGGRLFHAAGAV